MNQFQFCLLLCLAITAFTQNSISLIERTNFGKMLLEAVELQLDTSGDKVKVLTNMLQKLADDLEKKQTKANKAHQIFQQSCTEDIQHYNKQIEQAQKSIKDSNEALDELRPRLKKGQKDLTKSKEKLESLQEQLSNIIQQRKKEEIEYTKKQEEHAKCISTILKVKQLFSKLQNNESQFLQANIFTQISSDLKNAAYETENPSYKSILGLLAKVSENSHQSDQKILAKIIDLCEKIINNINESAAQEQTAENTRIDAYKKNKAKFEGEISNTNGEIARLTNLIESLKASIQANEEIIKDSQEKLEKNQQKLANRTSECNNEEAVYVQDKKKRNEERDTVDQVLQIVQTKLSTMSDYLKQRVNK